MCVQRQSSGDAGGRLYATGVTYKSTISTTTRLKKNTHD